MTSSSLDSPAAASMPQGFCGIPGGPSNGRGAKAAHTVTTAMVTAAAQATGRQRRDGSRPSGNSSTRNVRINPNAMYQGHEPSQPITSPPGSHSGRSSSA
jgi:hypothetical protein